MVQNIFDENLQRLIIEGTFLTIPDSIFFISFALVLSGFKEKLSVKKVFCFALLLSLCDIVIRLFLEEYGIHSFILILLAIFIMRFLFNLNYVLCVISYTMSIILIFVTQLSFFLLINILLGVDINNSGYILKILVCYIYFLLSSILLYIFIKKNIVVIDLNKQMLFLKSKNKSDFLDNIKLFLIVLLPIGVFLVLNFSIYYYQAFNSIKTSSLIYLGVNSIALIITNILMLILIRKLIKLKYYKIEWQTQQHCLKDVNNLLKGLRVQKHGFVNHMNVIFGLLTLGEYKNAKKYLSDINEIISTNNSSIGCVDNPTLSALLNVKAIIAENKNIRFDVMVDNDLSQMNFKAFEIGEAIGNVIDNAIEATCALDEKSRYVRISIYSDNKYYIFDIQNTGKTIPPEITEKIFAEGFSTKGHERDERGFGLYITKKIIEYNKGKIEVFSKNNNTSFKIFFPKVIKNEFKLS